MNVNTETQALKCTKSEPIRDQMHIAHHHTAY